VKVGERERLCIGGKEGLKAFEFNGTQWMPATRDPWPIRDASFGEVRIGGGKDGRDIIAGIQPMHGTMLAVYVGATKKDVISEGFGQGHALAVDHLTGEPSTVQIVAGWREPDSEGKVGIKMFVPGNNTYKAWMMHWIDQNGMACEDLQVADIDGDGRKDIVAAGRSTHNLKIYWNKAD
jgi:hypothetical protein